MRSRRGLAWLVAGAAAAVAGVPGVQALESVAVVSGLNGPVDFDFGPDGAIWWNEYYSGNVIREDPTTKERQVMFHADPVPDGVERGLVGLAVDPKGGPGHPFYVYYTVADPADPEGGTNRFSRVEDGRETVLFTLTANVMHNGGRILIIPDGTIFLSTGDNHRNDPAQDPGSLLGKILHVNADGSPAAGNLQGRVYSMGHRNVYGLAYDAEGKRLFATENSNAERDEVNLIVAGGNYGWPLCEGSKAFDVTARERPSKPCDLEGALLPIGEFYEEGTAAPTGAAFVAGRLYWGSWNEGAIHQMTETDDGWKDKVVHRPGSRINDLQAGPDGKSLYHSNWTHIFRVDLTDAELTPPPAIVGGPGPGGAGPGVVGPGSKGAGAVAFVAIVAAVAATAAARRLA